MRLDNVWQYPNCIHLSPSHKPFKTMCSETNWTWNKYLWSHPNPVENNNHKWHLAGWMVLGKNHVPNDGWTLNRGPSSISKGFLKNHGKNMDKTTISSSVLYCAPLHPYRNLTARKSPEIYPKPNRKGWFFLLTLPGARPLLKLNLYKVGVSSRSL